MNSLCPTLGPRKKTRRLFSQRGVTLVELMISTILFAMVCMATLYTLLTGYRVAATVRYRDQARFVLATVCDQFLRASLTDASGPSTRTFFSVTEIAGAVTPSGNGMAWYPDQQTFVIEPTPATPLGLILRNLCVLPSGTVTALDFPLPGNYSTPVVAHLSRVVRVVDPATGAFLPGDPVPTTAGYLLRGDFTITFDFQNRTYTESNAVLRSAK